MKCSVSEQLQSIILSCFNKKVSNPSISLLSTTYMLEPRDILFVIYKFVQLNRICLQHIPCWDYSAADLYSLSDYCFKILCLNMGENDNVQNSDD